MHFSDKSLWLAWISVTSVCMTIGFGIGAIGLPIYYDDQYLPIFLLAVITFIGFFIGIGQWLILRIRLKRAGFWVLATSIALPLGFFIAYWVVEILTGFIYVYDWIESFAMSTIAGLFIGSLQRISLRRDLKRIFSWMLVSALSWGFGVSIINLDFNILFPIAKLGFWYWPILGLLIGTSVGAINGAFVEWVLINHEE
jgi:hypothetical protein